MQNKKFFNKLSRAQSVIEYLLLVTVVIVVYLSFIAPHGVFVRAYKSLFDSTSNTVDDVIDDVVNGQLSF